MQAHMKSKHAGTHRFGSVCPFASSQCLNSWCNQVDTRIKVDVFLLCGENYKNCPEYRHTPAEDGTLHQPQFICKHKSLAEKG